MTTASNLVMNRESYGQSSLKWTNYWTNLTAVVWRCYEDQLMTDITLTAEGKKICCHKVILAACSTYFRCILDDNPSDHPIIILKNVEWEELKLIVEFMYRGHLKASEEKLPNLLKVAKMLDIRGLNEFSSDSSAFTVYKDSPEDLSGRKRKAEVWPPSTQQQPHAVKIPYIRPSFSNLNYNSFAPFGGRFHDNKTSTITSSTVSTSNTLTPTTETREDIVPDLKPGIMEMIHEEQRVRGFFLKISRANAAN